jgi:hypothetical protein
MTAPPGRGLSGLRAADLPARTLADRLPRQAILAVLELTDVIPVTLALVEDLAPDELAMGDYRPGRYAWIMTNPRPLATPIPMPGRQMLWWTPGPDDA